MRKIIASGAIAGAIALAMAAPASAVEDGKAELFVLHGVPDLTVDVYVNGDLTLDDFTPGTLAGPLNLDPGTYSVAITAADAADASAPVLGPIDLPLAANTSYTAVAHLDADGGPTASLFTNNIGSVPAGEGRLTVRHVAAAPAVDVLAGGNAIISNLANPAESVLSVPGGTYSVAVAAAGTTAPVLGPTDLPVPAGENTIVYAWGSLGEDNLALAVQTLDVAAASPTGVQAGTQGLAADDSSSGWPLTVTLMSLVAASGAAALVVRRRSASANV